MSNDIITTAAWRLESNLKAFIQAKLAVMRVPSQVLITGEFAKRTANVIVEIDAHSDLSDTEHGIAQSSNMQIVISGQIDKVQGKSHKDIVTRIYNSIWNVPKRDDSQLWASYELFSSVNKTPGAPDSRPCANIHLWDLVGPSASLDSVSATANTIIACNAIFSPLDWPGAAPYGI